MQRRDFLKKGKAGLALAALGTAAATAETATAPAPQSSATPAPPMPTDKNIPCRGYAAFAENEPLRPWQFERRPVGEHDILIEIKAASICHSDIHQERGHWGKQRYPQVPGHEIAGLVVAVGAKVTKFKVGDHAGVGCMVNNHKLEDWKTDEEQYSPDTVFTYGTPYPAEPTGISQGGYSNYLVVRDHFAVRLPAELDFEHAAPLMCAGITTYSPIMKYRVRAGDKVGVIGIGGLGHMAVKIAVSKGAEVYAFTTSPEKKEDILKFGAKEVIVVRSAEDLAPWRATLDYAISTVPYEFDIQPYISMVKPFGSFTVVGMPVNNAQNIDTLSLAMNRVNLNASAIGGIRETQEMVGYCARHHVLPQIEMITAEQINEAWDKIVNKQVRYRYVIDPKTF